MNEAHARLSLDISRSGDTAVIAMDGDLDPHTAPDLFAVLDQLRVDQDLRHLVLDLEKLNFLDSSGLRLIVSAAQVLTERGGGVTLRSPSAAARRVFEITDLLGEFEVDDRTT
jgi:stage II sporulation protein AA (anti-sigma F factor antagonist)